MKTSKDQIIKLLDKFRFSAEGFRNLDLYAPLKSFLSDDKDQVEKVMNKLAEYLAKELNNE